MTDKVSIEFEAQQLLDGIDKAIQKQAALDKAIETTIGKLGNLDTSLTKTTASFEKLAGKKEAKIKVDTKEVEAAGKVVEKTAKEIEKAEASWASKVMKKRPIDGANRDLQVQYQSALGIIQGFLDKEVISVKQANKILGDLLKGTAVTYTDELRKVQAELNRTLNVYDKFRSATNATNAGKRNVVTGEKHLNTLTPATGAGIKEQQAYAKAEGALLSFLSKSNFAAKDIDKMWGEVSSGNFNRYKNEFARLQQLIAGVVNANNALANSARRAAEEQLRVTERQQALANAVGKMKSIALPANILPVDSNRIDKAKDSLVQFLSKTKLTTDEVAKMWDKVAGGKTTTQASPELSKLQRLLVSLNDAYTRAGEAAQKAADKQISASLRVQAEKEREMRKQQLLDETRAKLMKAPPETAAKDVKAIEKAKTALLDFIKTTNLSGEAINRMWANLEKGKIKSGASGELGKLQQKLLDLEIAYGRISAAAEKAGEASKKAHDKSIEAAKRDEEAQKKLDYAKAKFSPIGQGTTVEQGRVENAQRRLLDFLNTTKLTDEQVKKLWNDFEAGATRVSGGSAGKLIGLLRNLENQVNRVGETSSREMARTNLQLEEQKRRLTELNFSWQTMFRLFVTQTAARGFGMIVEDLAEANRLTIELTKNLANIQTLDGSKTPAAILRKDLNELAGTYGLDVAKQAEGQYQVLSNQIAEGARSIRFMADANIYAKVANTDTASAVDTLSAAIHAYGLQAEDATDLGAKFAKVIDLGKVNGKELEHNLGRLLVPAAQLGVRFEEIGAAIATTTISGVENNVASTMLRNVMMSMLKPTKELTALVNEWGYESTQQAIQAEGFGNILARISEEVMGNQSALAQLFPNMRAFGGAAIFAGNGLNVFNRYLDQIDSSLDQYDEKVNIVMTNTTAKMEQAKAKIEGVFMQEITAPIIDTIAEVTNGFDAFVPSAEAVRAAGVLVADMLAFGIAVGGRKALISMMNVIKAVEAGTLAFGGFAAIATTAAIALSMVKDANELATESIERQAEELDSINEERLKQLAKETNAAKAHEKEVARAIQKELGERRKLLNAVKSLTAEQIKAVADANEKSIQSIEAMLNKTKDKVSTVKSDLKSLKSETQILIDDLNSAKLDNLLSGLDVGAQFGIIFDEIEKVKTALNAAAENGDKLKFDEAKKSLADLEKRQRDIMELGDSYDTSLAMYDLLAKQAASAKKAHEEGKTTFKEYTAQINELEKKKNVYADVAQGILEGAYPAEIVQYVKKKEILELENKVSYISSEDPEKAVAWANIKKAREELKLLQEAPDLFATDETLKNFLLSEYTVSLKEEQLTAEQKITAELQKQAEEQNKQNVAAQATIVNIKELAKAIEGFDPAKERTPDALAKEIDKQLASYEKLIGEFKKFGQDTSILEQRRDDFAAKKGNMVETAQVSQQQAKVVEIQARGDVAQRYATDTNQRAQEALANLLMQMNIASSQIQQLPIESRLRDIVTGGLSGDDRKIIDAYNGTTFSDATRTVTDSAQLDKLINSFMDFQLKPSKDIESEIAKQLEALPLNKPARSDTAAFDLYTALTSLKETFTEGRAVDTIAGAQEAEEKLKSINKTLNDISMIPTDNLDNLNTLLDNVINKIGAVSDAPSVSRENIEPTSFNRPNGGSSNQQIINNDYAFDVKIDGTNQDPKMIADQVADSVWRKIRYNQQTGRY